MSWWGLAAQGIQDTIGHILGFATGTHPTQTARHGMDMADKQYNLEQMNADRNYQHMLDKFEYDKQIQQKMFDREDTAVQRRAADMKAAGINPLLAAGSPAGAGTHVATTAPMKEVPNISPKMQALAMRQELYAQQKARSLQLSQLVAHLGLLQAQKEDTLAAAKEKAAHAAEITERTLGYEGQRKLNEAHTLHYIRSREHYNAIERQITEGIHLTRAHVNKVNQEISHLRIHDTEAQRNYNLAKNMGIRSDLKEGLTSQLQQGINFAIHTFGFKEHKEALNWMRDYIINFTENMFSFNLREMIPDPVREFMEDTAEAIRNGISDNWLFQRFMGAYEAINEWLDSPPKNRGQSRGKY